MKKKSLNQTRWGKKVLTKPQKAKSNGKVDPIYRIYELAGLFKGQALTNEEMDKFIYEH